eukprot:2757516-Pyramimonas_sp.AAC.2
MEVWCTELHDERELLEAAPLDDLYTAPTQMIPDNSALVTVAWGACLSGGTRATPTSRRRIMSQYASRSKTTVTDWTQTKAVNITDARCQPCNHHASIRHRRCKASCGCQGDVIVAKADIQANPEKLLMARCTKPNALFDYKCFKMQEISTASNIMTS